MEQYPLHLRDLPFGLVRFQHTMLAYWDHNLHCVMRMVPLPFVANIIKRILYVVSPVVLYFMGQWSFFGGHPI